MVPWINEVVVLVRYSKEISTCQSRFLGSLPVAYLSLPLVLYCWRVSTLLIYPFFFTFCKGPYGNCWRARSSWRAGCTSEWICILFITYLPFWLTSIYENANAKLLLLTHFILGLASKQNQMHFQKRNNTRELELHNFEHIFVLIATNL